MPIKIPKGFQRRKSSGNVLDEVQGAEPSFKVFARPHSSGKSVDMALAQQRAPATQRNSYEQEDDDLFTVMRPDAANRGSGGTENSLSTAPYDSGASSTRLSTSSTNPSSVDTRPDKTAHSNVQQFSAEPPAPPPHQHKPSGSGFLRNAGRTFSFGVKSKPPEPSEESIPPVPPVPATKSRFSFSQGRERAMTASSVSTATPPRLLESDLSLESSGLDNFESMFDGIGTKAREPSPIRRVPAEQSPAAYTSQQLRPDAAYGGRAAPPRPILVNRSEHIESSPYSWTSENSRDGLINTPSPANTITQNSPQTSTSRAMATSPRDALPPRSDSALEDNMFADTPGRTRAHSRPSRPPVPPPSSFPPVGRFNSRSQSNGPAAGVPLQASPILENEDAVFDPSLLASAELATKYQEYRPAPAPMPVSKKVMTPAQFELYKQQQNDRHRMNKVFQNVKPESDESEDDYEDDEEDEVERDKQVTQQRRKQEAHLAVYRQTMRKITGESPAMPEMKAPSVVGQQPAATQSTPDLSNPALPSINFDSKSPTRSSDGDDDDEDVPLGILAAHGFPNKNRPPNRLGASSSNPNLRGFAQAQPGPASVAGESVKRGSLPVFARHLPEDPYYGASIVNQAPREQMTMHPTTNNLSVPSGAATAHPHHPAGLVGVIAGEERARAMRRGSPNAGTGTFDLPSPMPNHPGMPRSQTTGSMPNMMMPPGIHNMPMMPNMPGMPGMPMMPGMPGMPMMPGMPPMLSPGDQAQIQMSHQMTQMMQMQMQWMQQMQSMMTGQPTSPNMQQMNQMPSMQPPSAFNQAAANVPRPQSVPLQAQSGHEQRSMSTLSPHMANWNSGMQSFRGGPGSAYAPSIAPSERSNVGLASRYRPVSNAPEIEQPPMNRRASTMTSATYGQWSQVGNAPKQAPPTIRKVAAAVDDDDDEQGWADMKAKKDQKKKTWKLRKGQNVLQELYNG